MQLLEYVIAVTSSATSSRDEGGNILKPGWLRSWISLEPQVLQMLSTATHGLQALCHLGVLLLSSESCSGNAGGLPTQPSPSESVDSFW